MNTKDKRFSVTYAVTTSYESVVEAKSKLEAINKVQEVVGDDIRIERAWELKKRK